MQYDIITSKCIFLVKLQFLWLKLYFWTPKWIQLPQNPKPILLHMQSFKTLNPYYYIQNSAISTIEISNRNVFEQCDFSLPMT